MDEGKFAADFIAENFVKILKIATKTLGKVDEELKIKLKTAYKSYLTNTSDKYSKSKSFFIRNQQVNLYDYYVPIGIKCGTKLMNEPKFSNVIDFSKHSVITGTGGCGKTILMKHLFLDCIKDKNYAPILVELRDLNSEKISLDAYVIKTLDTFGFNVTGNFVKKAKEEGHFAFFLDGYDEVNHSFRKNLMKQIKQISNKYPDCPIVISSRPDDDLHGIDHFSIFKVLPLTLGSASSLIEKLPSDKKIKSNFKSDLISGMFEKHKSFLSNPLLLSIMLLTYGENAEIPSKLSIFYNQAYEALFNRHDAYKEGYNRERLTDLDIQDFSRVFALFALQTYQKNLIKMPRTSCLEFIEKCQSIVEHELVAEDYLEDLLSAACLLMEDGLEIAFSHRSFQEYFVAKYISQASPEVQLKLIDIYKANMKFDRVIDLLFEINPDLVERALFLPFLENLFSKIGVLKKVGISHAAKYIKQNYEEIRITEESISMIYKDKKIGYGQILDLFISSISEYEIPESKYYHENSLHLLEKYLIDSENEKGKSLELDTEKLTYRTPILMDILNGKGKFSLEYLQVAFKAYKKLKKKYDNQIDDLDNLLGLH